MKHIPSGWLSIFAAFGFLLHTGSAFSAEPPKIPGKVYVKTADGCGVLFDDHPSMSPGFLGLYSQRYWLGECKHGLANGLGFWWDKTDWRSSHTAYLSLGVGQFPRANIDTRNGVSEFGIGSQLTYTLWNESKTSFAMASVPTHWNINAPLTPFYNSNNGSSLDDFYFTLSDKNSSKTEKKTEFSVSVDARSCLVAGKNISGCKAVFNDFDVYGVLIQNSIGTESKESFTLCPDPKTTAGCDVLWRELAGPYIERITTFVKNTQAVMAAELEGLAKTGEVAETALPANWKDYWKAGPINRASVDMAMKCRELSDFSPVGLSNAFYIKQKYSMAPCSSAITANFAVEQADAFVKFDSMAKDQDAAMREGYAKAKTDLDAYNAEAWSGFFKTTSAMLGAQMQIQQQRIDQTNAQIAASNSAPAPVYQPYGQPAASVPQSADPGKTQVRAIHKPELDAGSCVKLAQLANGDPLSSFGSQVFSNQCGQTVEVFWCKVGDECERGAGGSTTLGADRSWPVTSGQYHFGACIGANSGALVRNSGGVHTGRYACTGP